MELVLPHWVDADRMLAILDSWRDASDLWGDIYARTVAARPEGLRAAES